MGKLKGSSLKERLDGRTVVITGANSGIGKITAEDLYRRGATLFMLCRNITKANEAINEIKANCQGQNQEIEALSLDLSSMASVRKCAAEVLEKCPKIHIQINNAGVSYCPYHVTEDGFEMTMATNYLGHYLLTELLLPSLVKAAEEDGIHPRIVILSSMAHLVGKIRWDDFPCVKEKDYDKLQAYNDSKLANLLHANELARRLKDKGIIVVSLHPGVVSTDITRHMFDAWFGPCLKQLWKLWSITPMEGAQTTIYCAVSPDIDMSKTGKYFQNCKPKTPAARGRKEAHEQRLAEKTRTLEPMRNPIL